MIYLDNAATTKPSATAVDEAVNFYNENYYNPSALYKPGLAINSYLNSARENILKSLGVSSSDYKVIFTSCGSESDNLAIFGNVKRGSFVTDAGEHSAVYKSFIELANKGNEVKFISLNKDGSVNQEELFDYVSKNKVDFVSIVHVNNETGAINDVNKIADTIKKISPKTIFHSDGVQAYCKILYRLSKNVDLYSVSAHKINALKGVGALIAKKKLNLNPIIIGGGQENGVRSGTENVFGIRVFDNAIKEKMPLIKQNYEYVSALKNNFLSKLDRELFTVISSENSSPYVLSISAKGLKGEIILHMLESKGIIIGNGSACSSKNPFSRVIEACGYDKSVLSGVIRISFSADITLDEVDCAVKILNEETKKLKEII